MTTFRRKHADRLSSAAAAAGAAPLLPRVPSDRSGASTPIGAFAGGEGSSSGSGAKDERTPVLPVAANGQSSSGIASGTNPGSTSSNDIGSTSVPETILNLLQVRQPFFSICNSTQAMCVYVYILTTRKILCVHVLCVCVRMCVSVCVQAMRRSIQGHKQRSEHRGMSCVCVCVCVYVLIISGHDTRSGDSHRASGHSAHPLTETTTVHQVRKDTTDTRTAAGRQPTGVLQRHVTHTRAHTHAWHTKLGLAAGAPLAALSWGAGTGLMCVCMCVCV